VARQAAASAGAERMRVVHALVATLAVAGTLEQVAKAVLDQACTALGASAGTLMLCSSNGLSLEAVGAVGYPAGSLEAELPLTMPVPLATAVRLGEAVLLPSAGESRSAGYAQRPDCLLLGHGAWAAAPLQVGGRTVGAFELSFMGPRVFGEDDRAFLWLLAAEGGQAIERVQLISTLARLAPIPTTGRSIALSAREQAVLERVVEGLTNREIAGQLGLGIDTIKTHVDHICEKLAVAGSSRSRVLAVRAIQLGLVPTGSFCRPAAVSSQPRATRTLGLQGPADCS